MFDSAECGGYGNRNQSSYLFNDASAARRSESLNGKVFALLHPCIVVVFDQHDRLATISAMNHVRDDGVPAEVFDGLD